MPPILEVDELRKVYAGGFEALKGVSLEIQRGEIVALLGPNGAGKTTLISAICGLVQPSSGTVRVGGHDTIRAFREARALIGLVPQEMNLDPFDKVLSALRFSRGLFGKPRDDAKIEEILKQFSLWDKRNEAVRMLSGGMKRRVLIAKALAHEPQLLFLDEPTAGVDVELRKDMWQVVETLKAQGVTIVLTTHYIEEAEAIADRIGVIANGEMLLIEEKDRLMRQMGKKHLDVHLAAPIGDVPASLDSYGLERSADGLVLTYTYDRQKERTGITRLLAGLSQTGLVLRDVETRQSSLEDIFVDLVHTEKGQKP